MAYDREEFQVDGSVLFDDWDSAAGINQNAESGYVNAADLGLLKSVFFSADPVADFDSSGSVNAIDLGLMKLAFFKSPGPAAEPNLCSPRAETTSATGAIAGSETR